MRGVWVVTQVNGEEFHYAGLLSQNTAESLTICPGEKTKPVKQCIGSATVIPWDTVVTAWYMLNGETVVRPDSGA
jgi:hypothetical protein